MRHYRDPSRSSRFVLGLPRLAVVCLMAGGVFASTVPAWSAAPADPAGVHAAAPWQPPVAAQDSAPATKASFTHSGMKTVTHEIGNALDNFVFLSVGSGGLASGVLLTAFNTMQSWTVYTTND
jgi:hypothetical protein